MRFPHLYGPLPVTAVVAVVPYRPPAPVALPAPDDALGRALAFVTSLPIRRAVGVGDVPGGVAVLDPDLPHSHDNNRLLLTAPVDAATGRGAPRPRSPATRAGRTGRPALLWPGADDVAAELARRGWETERARCSWPGRRAGPPAVTARRGGRPARGARLLGAVVAARRWPPSWARGSTPPWSPTWSGREHLNDRVVAVTDLVVREEGRVVAAGQLRVDGATAAVDSVLTDPAARGRGHADAVLARALDLAADAGCDLVVLEAAAARLAAALVRPARLRGGRFGVVRGPASPDGSDRREDGEQQVGHRGRRQQRVQPVHEPAVAGQQVAHVLDAEVALDQRLAEVADGGRDGDRGAEDQSRPPRAVQRAA